MERKKALGIGLTAVVVAALIGWIAGRQIQSPAEIAANTDAPGDSLISVPVERTRLASEVTARGTVGFGDPVEVTAPASALKSSETMIVTTLPKRNEELQLGQVAFTLSGRPVFVLQGDQPASRDLVPGTRGADVQQLEDGLAALGFDPGPRDGLYDGRTASAVAAWYEASGQTPFGPTPEQLTALRSAQESQGSASAEVAGAEEALAQAQEREAQAIGLVGTKQAALQDALAAQQLADQQLADGRAQDPPLTFVELTALETAARTAAGAVGLAQSELDAANAALGPAAEGVRAAERRVGAARGRAGTAGAGVGDIAGRMGISVPANEVLFLRVVPAKVNDITAQIGQEASGPLMTIAGSELAIESSLTRADQELVRVGARARIEEPRLNLRAEGTVSLVADTAGPPPADLSNSRFRLVVEPINMPASFVGESVAMRIDVGGTSEEVLAVPVGALSVSANGDSRVQVQEKGGRTRTVIVTPGLQAQGLVAVTPERGSLQPGDLVVLGRGAQRSRPIPAPTTRPATPSTTVPPESRGSAGG